MPAGTRATQDPQGSTAFKDRIDATLVADLADALLGVEPSFPAEDFRRAATEGLADLELKARIAHVAIALQRHLSADFEQSAAVIAAVLDPIEAGRATLDGWELWPVTDWVARAGRDHPEVALELLGRLTRHATGEFAVRPFIDDDPAGVLRRFRRWVGDGEEHRCRLVSEGTRPRLPWSPRLAVATDDPAYAVALLDELVEHPSEYVRRSVSNHLNDLCRVDATLALPVAQRWSRRAGAEGGELGARIDWVVRRGLRSLVKDGHPDALRLLGHDPDASIGAEHFEITTPFVQLGDEAEWSVTLVSGDDVAHRVVVDYTIGFPRADGRPGRKVFKWTTVELGPGERRVLARRHRVRPVTIRTHRAGPHPVEVQVNGRVVASGSFELVVP